EDPDESVALLSLVTAGARHVLADPLAVLDQPHFESPARLFWNCAEAFPEQVALQAGHRTWLYNELRQRALGLADVLAACAVGPGTVVVVAGHRSPNLIAGLLGVLLAGGVVLMLDRKLPEKRQRLMLREARAKTLLWAEGEAASWLKEMEELEVIEIDSLAVHGAPATEDAVTGQLAGLASVDPEGAAYIFFTSGTSGIPKGIVGRQKGLSHFLTWQSRTFGIGPGDRSAQLTGISFDVVLRDILTPLISG